MARIPVLARANPKSERGERPGGARARRPPLGPPRRRRWPRPTPGHHRCDRRLGARSLRSTPARRVPRYALQLHPGAAADRRWSPWIRYKHPSRCAASAPVPELAAARLTAELRVGGPWRGVPCALPRTRGCPARCPGLGHGGGAHWATAGRWAMAGVIPAHHRSCRGRGADASMYGCPRQRANERRRMSVWEAQVGGTRRGERRTPAAQGSPAAVVRMDVPATVPDARRRPSHN